VTDTNQTTDQERYSVACTVLLRIETLAALQRLAKRLGAAENRPAFPLDEVLRRALHVGLSRLWRVRSRAARSSEVRNPTKTNNGTTLPTVEQTLMLTPETARALPRFARFPEIEEQLRHEPGFVIRRGIETGIARLNTHLRRRSKDAPEVRAEAARYTRESYERAQGIVHGDNPDSMTPVELPAWLAPRG